MNAKTRATIEDDQAIEYIEAIALRRLGLFFSEDQKPAIRKRLLEAGRRLNLPPAALLRRLNTDSAWACGLLADVLSTNHTSFFREPTVLRRISTDILSSLDAGRQARIWSAAASTGQEAYSVAILLAETVGAKAARERFAILGTDLVRRVVTVAEQGRYGPADITNVDLERRARWFHQHSSQVYEVNDAIKDLCTFRTLNLVAPKWPFSRKFSVILCRNVLYYLQSQTQKQILERIYEVCAPGGWLLTSVSESIQDLSTPWLTLEPGVHRKLEGRKGSV
ncbi:MAG: protein-glutamate O-methyltransferase CheR [Myxococcota bacterium]